MFRRWPVLLVLFGAVAALYQFVARPRFGRWGATAEDLVRDLPGDGDVPDANYHTTLAIDVDAPPSAIWPWLAQLGRGRGGLYSYDFLDRLFGILDAQSAKQILPEYQELRAGDVIPVGKNGPDFPVKAAVPGEYLLLEDAAERPMWSWYLGMAENRDGTTKLISRNHGRFPGRFLRFWMEPAAFLMTRKMLLNLRDRAEGGARAAPPTERPAPEEFGEPEEALVHA